MTTTTADLIHKGALINAGNFQISIGTFDTGDVAIISKRTGQFVSIKTAKKSKKLRQAKRMLKVFLNSDTTFTFQFMTNDLTVDLIHLLKK